ncbi:MAG TPA: hypothetical protein VGQ16_02175 [Vicinamibacterales bacterium]|jgi:hypothetical protein|nr:hypothetical protein [Vicinamibacterales bacterium]
MIRRVVTAGAVWALAVLLSTISTAAFAQGKSQAHKNSAPPSRNDLASPSGAAVGSGAASPIAWVDDATVVDSGGVSVAISTIRWTGSGMSEVNFPVVDIAFGLTPHVQLSASVPRVVGSADPAGAAGGLGTSYFSMKLAVVDDHKRGLKVAVSPTLEVLSPGVVEWLAPGEHRVQIGFPVSAQWDRGQSRLYGATGYFSRGAWFMGTGAAFIVNDKVAVSGGFSRAWRRSIVPDVPLGDRDRNEISGSGSYALTPSVRLFGSLGRTIATLEENGAGTTIGGGLSLFFTTPVK